MDLKVFINDINIYALVFCRVGGMLLFNPLIQRKNIPGQFKLALVLGITVLLAPGIGGAADSAFPSGLLLLFAMIKELALGAVCGYVFQVFYLLLSTAGDLIDMGFGLSMAKAFDPGTNMQLSITGNFFQLLFAVYFFATDSHLVFIKLIASSYDIVGPGSIAFGPDIARFGMTLFVSAFSLVLHLALPFAAASFVLEIAMGILMKLIPQINVFSIHFQVKILLGVVLLFVFAVPITSFLQQYIDTMLAETANLLKLL